MKRKSVNLLLAVTAAVSMSVTVPAVWAADAAAESTAAETAAEESTAGGTAAAEEGTAAGTAAEENAAGGTAAEANAAGGTAAEANAAGGTAAEENTAAGTAADQIPEQEKVPEDIKLSLESGEVTITNKAEIVFSGAEYVKSAVTAEDGTEIWNLVLTEDGEAAAVHTFENVSPAEWTEPAVIQEFGILYITYKNADGTEGEALETALEKELEEPVTVYAVTDVHVRKEAGTESDSLKVTSLGAEWKAVACTPGWVKVEGDGITGYIFHSYVTDDKEKVDALIKEAEEARAAAAQAQQQSQTKPQTQPQAPAVQPEEPAPQPEEPVQPEEPAPQPEEPVQPEEPAPQPEEPYEVSRQKYDDCDGSGHGYWEITMSDGSIRIEEY